MNLEYTELIQIQRNNNVQTIYVTWSEIKGRQFLPVQSVILQSL